MTSSVTYIKHSLVPQKREQQEFFACSIADLDPHWERPYIAILDGKAVLRKDWDIMLYCGHALIFIDVTAIPQGGGSSNPLQVIAMIVVTVVAVVYGGPAGGAAASSMFGAGAAGVGSAVGTAVVMAAGSALVNAVLPPATTSIGNTSANMQAASPTYSLQAQGNFARLEQAIPEHFGRHIVYPDFAAMPYQEFYGNEQYLYQLLCIGRGSYSLEGFMVEDTPLTSFPNVEFEIVGPNQPVSLFPANVITSAEVAGQTIPYGSYTTPFVANPAEYNAVAIGIDIVFPKGLFFATNDGTFAHITVGVTTSIRTIDNNGLPTSAWMIHATEWVGGATSTPQRFSFRYAVSPGRYEVRLTRLTDSFYNSRYGDDLVWAGLRSYIPDTNAYGDCTLVAIKMQAGSQLSAVSSRKINVVATRKLPTWTGSAWTAPTATRSIAWALAYCCKQAGFTDSQIDLATLFTLHQTWSTRGDWCDGRIDSFLSFWDSLAKIASAGRCKPFMQGGVMRFFRDQAATLPVALFSMQNIVRGSFSVDYLMPTTDTADAIDVGYFDGDVWKQRRVQARLAGSTAAKPTKMETNFIVSRAHAHREGLYQSASNRYRRKIIHLQTEMDGFIPSFGDLIVVQHDMPAWGQGGEVIAHNSADKTIKCSEPLTYKSGETHYIGLRRLNGEMYGPIAVTRYGTTDDTVVYSGTLPFVFSTDTSQERTHYTFGWGATWGQRARVLSVTPKSLYGVEIEAVNEDESVHTADVGVTVPIVATSQLAGFTAYPIISGLTIASSPTDIYEMRLSWNPSPWADYYLVQQAGDGVMWTPSEKVYTPVYIGKALYGPNTKVRVSAVGQGQGAWAYINFPAEAFIAAMGNVTGLTSFYRAGMMVLSWTAVTDMARVVDYEIRKGAAWKDAQVLGRTSNTEYPTDGDGSYWVAAHSEYAYSANPALIVIEGSSLQKNVVAVWNEQGSGWTGTLTGGACVVGSSVTLGGAGVFSVIPLLSAVSTVAYYGGVSTSGSYTIPSGHEIDIGTVQDCNCSVSYTARADNPFQLFSSVPLVSAMESVGGNYSGQAGATIQIATSDLAGTYGAWRDFYPGVYVGRKFKFRANLWSINTSIIAVLSGMIFTVDMEDRYEKGTGVAIVAGGTSITYATPFQIRPNVQVTILSASQGDDVVLTAETASGCTVQIINGGVGVARNINWLAQGY